MFTGAIPLEKRQPTEKTVHRHSQVQETCKSTDYMSKDRLSVLRQTACKSTDYMSKDRLSVLRQIYGSIK